MQAQTHTDQTAMAFVIPKNDPSKAQLRLANADWQSLTQQPRIRIDVLIDGQAQPLKPVETFSAEGKAGVIIPFGKNYAPRLFRDQSTVAVDYRDNTLLIL
jgi:hypothetical protein